MKWLSSYSSVFPNSPAILSTLYGYDDCIGGVNNFDTEEEYYQELKRWEPDLWEDTIKPFLWRRNCTVVTGPDGKEVREYPLSLMYSAFRHCPNWTVNMGAFWAFKVISSVQWHNIDWSTSVLLSKNLFYFPLQGDKCGSLKCVEAALWIVWHMGVDGRNASENVLLEQKTFQKNLFVLASWTIDRSF